MKDHGWLWFFDKLRTLLQQSVFQQSIKKDSTRWYDCRLLILPKIFFPPCNTVCIHTTCKINFACWVSRHKPHLIDVLKHYNIYFWNCIPLLTMCYSLIACGKSISYPPSLHHSLRLFENFSPFGTRALGNTPSRFAN